MARRSIGDWDDAYANAQHIPDGNTYPDRWAKKAAAFRALIPPRVLYYGNHPREKIDLFRSNVPSQGRVVFVHGGYWRAFDRKMWSHLAAGSLARGWTVAIPEYVLAPEARVKEITRAIGRAVAAAASTVSGPIRLAGHSAGGHLVTRQVCEDDPLPVPVAERVERVISISGLHDLRPLLRTKLNSDLQLDLVEARAESPALLEPKLGTRIHAWVGAKERPEFIRQTKLISTIWTGAGAETEVTVEDDRHHFDVIEGLEQAGHPLTTALCDND